jgi:hypothetical protein
VVQTGERWLQVELLGEIDRGTRHFRRGVGSYPGLDDPVHFATSGDLTAVFPQQDEDHLRLGSLAAAEDVPVCVDAGRLVLRHAAVTGSTGAGKTSAVASLLQGFVRGGWCNANIVVIDPHGEYQRALEPHAATRSVLAAGENQLRVPFWALPAAEILQVFTGGTGGATTLNRFSDITRQQRQRFVEEASWLQLDPAAVTADTPVPFDINEVWYTLDYENNETRAKKGDPDTVEVEDAGDAATLRPARFATYSPGAATPDKAPTYGSYGRTPDVLRLGLLDKRLQFFLQPAPDPHGDADPLVAAMDDWLGGGKPISVLDFAGVPDEAAELAIGVVLNLLFEVAVRSEPEGPGIGRSNPVLVVLEEAHRYLGDAAAAIAGNAANRIAREGRKYGVGLMLVTQRPSELPDTALAQCGTLIALRLSNSQDQGKIRAALPDSVAGLAASLPSLLTGEAVVSGEAVVLPTRTLIDCPDPLPRAEDPSLRPWRDAASVPDLARPLAAWRGTYEEAK